jgi:hypothetical protein
MHRWAIALLAAFAAACAVEVPVTVREGSVLQSVYTLYSNVAPVEMVLVVDDADTPEAASLRAAVMTVLEKEAFGELGHSDWTHVDVRAFVARPGGSAFVTPDEDPRLAWREDDGTEDAARRFVSAIAEAIAEPATTPRTSPVEAFRAGLALTSNALAIRTGIVASTRDDPRAEAEVEPELDRSRDRFVAVLPTLDDCKIDRSTRLAAWAARNTEPSSSCLFFIQFVNHSHSHRCAPHPIAVDADGAPRCRVRASLDDGSPCDPARGHRPISESSSAEGVTVCDVVRLDGATCIERGQAREVSGWCVPESASACGPSVPVTFVGGAFRLFTRYEIACEHAP